MRNGGKRPRRKRSEFAGRPRELGALLADLRTAKGLSLREVEEATDKAVSNAYLSQLENGKIKKPPPNVLHSLAEVYVVPYEALMEKAGYLLPAESGGGRRKKLAAFAIDDLTAEEEEELLKYLAFLRSRLGSEIDLHRGSPCSFAKISLLPNVRKSPVRTPEWASVRAPAPPRSPIWADFPAFSLRIWDLCRETSSRKTASTAISSAVAESPRPRSDTA